MAGCLTLAGKSNMFNGKIIKESLKDESALDKLTINGVKEVSIDNPAEDQPSTWTLMDFEVEDTDAETIAQLFSVSLKTGTWYVDFSSAETTYVVFPEKVFKYQKGDEYTENEIKKYGRSIGIPEKQLQWP